MYNLCELKLNDYDNSSRECPMMVIAMSENVSDINAEIVKRVRDGCPAKALKVYLEVPFEIDYAVTLGKAPRGYLTGD